MTMPQPGMPMMEEPMMQGGGAMPLPVDSLTPESPLTAVREAISQSIAACMKEGGKTQKECAGMAYGIARDKTGKDLAEGTQR